MRECKHKEFKRISEADFICKECGINIDFTRVWFLATPHAIKAAEAIYDNGA